MALSSTAQEALWLRELNKDLNNPSFGPTLIIEDNQSAICMSKNPQFHGRSKHINIKIHFIREQVTSNNICLKFCPSEDMVADRLMKGVNPERFEKLRKYCGLRSYISCEECRKGALSTPE